MRMGAQHITPWAVRSFAFRGLRNIRASFTLLKTTKPGDYAPRNDIERERRMREEHAGD
jgi:hypothetical protein